MTNEATTKPATMRELLAKWTELEPDKIEREHWNDLVSNMACEEFRISGVAVLSDFLKVGESSPALIQWAVQQAIVARGWWFETYYSPNATYEGVVIIPSKARAKAASDTNMAEALLGAYLKVLESSAS